MLRDVFYALNYRLEISTNVISNKRTLYCARERFDAITEGGSGHFSRPPFYNYESQFVFLCHRLA